MHYRFLSSTGFISPVLSCVSYDQQIYFPYLVLQSHGSLWVLTLVLSFCSQVTQASGDFLLNCAENNLSVNIVINIESTLDSP